MLNQIVGIEKPLEEIVVKNKRVLGNEHSVFISASYRNNSNAHFYNLSIANGRLKNDGQTFGGVRMHELSAKNANKVLFPIQVPVFEEGIDPNFFQSPDFLQSIADRSVFGIKKEFAEKLLEKDPNFFQSMSDRSTTQWSQNNCWFVQDVNLFYTLYKIDQALSS